ncbi:ribose 5-phosphate isomerase B [Candidatus Woesearchaeota archaeon]|nr:ribose 5-phosphate isomerase B [Candidatus Woesearchaeota archaeon]
MVIYIAADHAGFKLKEYIKRYLKNKKIKFYDLGTFTDKKRVDYPDYAVKASKKVARNKNSKGILICGTGTGMVMAANKINGIRAALAYDKYSAIMARHDNNANVLCLRGRKVNFSIQKKVVNYWLNSRFSNLARHILRIN